MGKSEKSGKNGKKQSFFTRFSKWVAYQTGRPMAFILAVIVVLLWAVTGPMFNYSDTWQLVINTGTTIVTFLMVFMIQNTQNRDSTAVQLKLDEIIRAVEQAQNKIIDAEDLDEEDLEELKVEFQELAEQAREDVEQAIREKTSS